MNSCQVVGNTHRKHTTSDRHYLLALLQNTSLLPVKWNSSARRPDLPLYSMVKQLSGKIMIISLPCVSLHFLNNSNTFQLQEMLRKVEAASTHRHSAASLLPSSVSGPSHSSLPQWCAPPRCGPWWWPPTSAQHWPRLHSHPAHHHARSQSAWVQWHEGCSWQSSTPLWSSLGPPAPSVPAVGYATVSQSV